MPQSPASALATQLPGLPSSVGAYQILGKLGTGGMATVYLAKNTGVGGFEREVALKLVHSHLEESESPAEHLLREARLAARIRHQNVVQVFDVGEDEAGLYLVMEYVEGGTLDALVRRATARGETLPPAIALRIMTDALRGLHAAHELKDDKGVPLGLVHRDFSPQNILVGVDGSVRLADFGIAKLTRSVQQTRSGTLKGKAGYMAPEQVRSRTLDRRCDVWAAGVVAWELFAGRRLQEKMADEMATLMRILTVRPPRLRKVNSEFSKSLDSAVAGALEQNVERRTPSAAAFREALLAAAGGDFAPAEPGEVALYVQRELSEVLAIRRAKIAASRESQEDAPELSSLAEDQTALTRTGFSSGVASIRPRRNRAGLVLIAAAILLVLGVLFGRLSAPEQQAAKRPEQDAPAAPASAIPKPPTSGLEHPSIGEAEHKQVVPAPPEALPSGAEVGSTGPRRGPASSRKSTPPTAGAAQPEQPAPLADPLAPNPYRPTEPAAKQ